MKCLILILLIYVTINIISADETSYLLNQHNYGEALKLITFKESEHDNLMESLEEGVLKKLLLNDEVIKRKIVVVSVVGGFRKGKTYIIDYCLRYLYANYKSINFMDNPLKSSSNWIGEEDEALKGFSFRSGSKSKNTEMVIWSDVFLDNNQRDGDLAIILMDTQGFFKKGERTFTPNSRTFSIGSLVGSVLILNLNSHIKLEEMKYLEMSTAYTKDTLKCHQTPFSKPFQNLNFILRNWSNIEQFPFGLNVGNQFIMKSFDNTQCIKNIKSSFENINSFLMPFPGNTIRLKKSTGCWSEMNVEYKKQLQLLIEHILAPERLEIKKVNGVQMTGAKLNEKIKAHFKAIQSKVLVDEYTKIYKQELTKTFRAADPMNEKSFKSSHLSSKERVQAMKKISNSDLASYLNEAFDEAFKEMNYNQTKFNELNVTIKNELFKHKHGEALNVICFDGENKEIRINDTVVSSLMDHLIIRDRKVVVVSMTGLYRHGKSTFMDYCLRYLYAHYKSLNFMNNPLSNSANWIGNDDDLLTGFTFKGGEKLKGTGIVFWSDVFLYDDEKGEKIAIFLVDSQGFFEKNIATNESKVLQFNTLMSSIQIFNLRDKLNLEYLEFATNYAEHLKVGTMPTSWKNKPLQSLLFLSRDWPNEWQGPNGTKLLEKMLHSNQVTDNKKVQQHIPLSYDSVKCSILPHPGENIKSVFNHGQLSMVSNVFKDALKAIIEEIFCPTNLVTKKIGEFEITVSELLEYMKAYLDILQKTKTPTAELFSEKTVEIQMQTFVERDLALFNQKLTTITIGNQNEVNLIQDNMILQFKQRTTISDSIDMKNQFLNELKSKMNESVLNWRKNPVTTPPGKPVNLLSFVNPLKPVLNIKDLTDVLMHDDVKNRKLVVFAITGITGTKRTFLMNYFLRYMYANYKSINYKDNQLNYKTNWIGDEDEPLKGFPLDQEQSNSIEFWSDVFLDKNDADDEIAILFMVSRGLFNKLTHKNDVKVFLLPSFISSIQIFNLERANHKEITFLLDAIDYSKKIIKYKKQNSDHDEIFQKMIFLMRNWILPHEHSYGYGGGDRYMLKEFSVDKSHSQYAEITHTRDIIQSTFEPNSCFLLPSQGKDVLFTNYQGQWRQLDEDFKKHLVIFIEDVLRPSNLVTKKIDGKELTAQEFLQVVKNYFELMETHPPKN